MNDANPSAANEGRLPDFVIIGAMKCGTTSLHNYLNCHPEVSMSHPKELNFFTEHQRWRRGLSWYRSNFARSAEKTRVWGESSPNYTRHPLFPGVPERMHAVIPNAKLIYCVRDPVERVVSHYVHDYSVGRQSRPFAEAVLDEREAYLWVSRYAYQLERYRQVYPMSQLKIVVLEELRDRPQETLRSVFEFIGVDPTFWDRRFERPSRIMPPAKMRRRSPLKIWMKRNHVRGMYWLERNLPWVFGAPIERPDVSSVRHALVEALEADTDAFLSYTGLEPEWTLGQPEKPPCETVKRAGVVR